MRPSKIKGILGITLPTSREILVGAKNLLSSDQKEVAKARGVVAEELCHFAMKILFDNDAKPFREQDKELQEQFSNIVREVHSLSISDSYSVVEQCIKDVFGYHYSQWECELIARVPYIIGIYEEKMGREILQKTEELSNLLKFYDTNVVPMFEKFSYGSSNTKYHHMMDQLTKNDFLSFHEKRMRPVGKNFPSFEQYLVDESGVSFMYTNSVKLCSIQVFHEVRDKCKHQFEEELLFFSIKIFQRNWGKMKKILGAGDWEYFIILMDEKYVDMSKFKYDYLNQLREFKTGQKKMIIISGSQAFGDERPLKKIHYKWTDLEEYYKHSLISPLEYIFKGKRERLYLRENDISGFSEDEFNKIISGELFKVNDGKNLISLGYVPETYIQRALTAMTVDRRIFKELPRDACIFLSRLRISNSLINERLVQKIKSVDDEIEQNKSIYLIENEQSVKFEDLKRKSHTKANIWLQHINQSFYLRQPLPPGDVLKQFWKPIQLGEMELLEFLKSNKVVILSDNAGYGKSTVISSIICDLKNQNDGSWLWRIDFSKSCADREDPKSIAHIKEDDDKEKVLAQLLLMLGIKNSLEKRLFREKEYYGKCFIFFDGFDEVPSKYRSNAIKLLSTVRMYSSIKLLIATRKHHQEELEDLLNSFSFELVPFSRDNQLQYLSKLWKNKLKFPNGEKSARRDEGVPKKIKEFNEDLGKLGGDFRFDDLKVELKKVDLKNDLDILRTKIDELNFHELAKYVLDKCMLDDEMMQFVGIPLHLYMVGVIYLDGNLNLNIGSDIYSLYLNFIEQKILIYVRDKQQLNFDGAVRKIVMISTRKDAYKIHMQLADHLLEKGEMSLEYGLKKRHRELCSALGIVSVFGKQVQFIHRTYAEFFKAESVRQKVIKEEFLRMLQRKDYKVIRRFFVGSLEKQNLAEESHDEEEDSESDEEIGKENSFGYLSKEFFEDDINFLVQVMMRVLAEDNNFKVQYVDSNLWSIFKIVRILMHNLEKIDDENDFVDKFIEGLKERSTVGIRYGIVGACIPKEILKKFLITNFKVHSVKILYFLRFTEDGNEGMSILEECISILKNSCEGTIESSHQENREEGSMLQILKISDKYGNGLFYYAAFNEKSDILVRILMFLRQRLGKVQFLEKVIESEEYQHDKYIFMDKSDVNLLLKMLKELLSKFDDETEFLFSDVFKRDCLSGLASNIDGISCPFEEIIKVIHSYFGTDALYEVLEYSERNLVEIFHCIKDYFKYEENKMKGFIMNMDKHLSGSIFRLAAFKRDVYFNDILQICRIYLDKDEIQKMLLVCNEDGENVAHWVFRNNSSKILYSNIKTIKGELTNDDMFKELIMGKSRKSWNIFFHLIRNKNEINLSFLNSYLEESELADLLTEKDDFGMTCLHLAAFVNSIHLLSLIECANEVLRTNKRRFEKLFLEQDKDGNTFLHKLCEDGDGFLHELGEDGYTSAIDFENKVFFLLRDTLSNKIFHDLLVQRNKKGQTFLEMDQKKKQKRTENVKVILRKELMEMSVLLELDDNDDDKKELKRNFLKNFFTVI